VATTTEMMEERRQQDEDMTVGYGRVVTSTSLARRRNRVGPAVDRYRCSCCSSPKKEKSDPDNRTWTMYVYGGSVVVALTAKKNRQDTNK